MDSCRRAIITFYLSKDARMSAKHCDDCGINLGKRYKALDGRHLCSKCRGLRAEAFEIVLHEITHRTKQERLLSDKRKYKQR